MTVVVDSAMRHEKYPVTRHGNVSVVDFDCTVSNTPAFINLLWGVSEPKHFEWSRMVSNGQTLIFRTKSRFGWCPDINKNDVFVIRS
jgi:hypothetical protein